MIGSKADVQYRDWVERTIRTKSPGHQRTIGQRDRLSFFDIQLINREYCSNQCGYTINCEMGGYQHPSDCNRCLCPEGLGGDSCRSEEPPIGTAECGGVLDANEDWADITNPPPLQDADRKCSWRIEIKNSSDLRYTGLRFCCFDPPTEAIKSEGRHLVLIFRTTVLNFSRFNARYRFTEDTGSTEYRNRNHQRPRPALKWRRGRGNDAIGPIAKDPAPASDWSWGNWGAWSACSASCGACGTRYRQRYCPYGECRDTGGWIKEHAVCGMPPCPGKPLIQGLQL